eukprot:TRINITY_DN2029_c0_g1_i1.p1 TRINITY_DN2029_c0_g1~~TRINITY_DN2029_c0_g1_i1.p1  ORF type:complete len:427 (-),score=101.41 TRINITY_DN2029_c0_g1_i1:788-2068(-)
MLSVEEEKHVASLKQEALSPVSPNASTNPVSSPKQSGASSVIYLVNGEHYQLDTRYKPLKAIGSGSYGHVCLAKDMNNGNQKVAIKKVKDVFMNVTDARRVLREVKLLRQLEHDNIVRLMDIIEPSDLDNYKDICLVMDFMQSDLKKVIYSDNELSEDHIAFIMYQVLCGLLHMHNSRVVHRDLKPGNILVNSNCKVKICDFGMARGIQSSENSEEDELTEYVVTRWYRAPELTWGEPIYDTAIDMWSVGCILAELFNRKTLFKGENYVDQLTLIISALGTPSEEDMEMISNPQALEYIKGLPVAEAISMGKLVPGAKSSEKALDLISKLLVFNPSGRMTALEALQHPFFSKFYNQQFVEKCCAGNKKMEFDYEKLTRTKESIRDLMFGEIVQFRPEALGHKFAKEALSADRNKGSFNAGRRRTLV